MTWLEQLGVRLALSRLQGGPMAQKAGGWAAMVGGVIAILVGVQGGLSHLAAGDLTSHWQEVLAAIMAGVGVFSPGMNAAKVGPFSRP
jgi:hypothetical protein